MVKWEDGGRSSSSPASRSGHFKAWIGHSEASGAEPGEDPAAVLGDPIAKNGVKNIEKLSNNITLMECLTV
jgi:hypothetical protein